MRVPDYYAQTINATTADVLLPVAAFTNMV